MVVLMKTMHEFGAYFQVLCMLSTCQECLNISFRGAIGVRTEFIEQQSFCGRIKCSPLIRCSHGIRHQSMDDLGPEPGCLTFP
jgi:hypothetical protein